MDASKTKGLPRYQSLQPLYSLVERDTFEGDLENLCEAENVGVIGFYSLASGFLTGKYRSKADMEGRIRAPRVEKYMTEDGFRVLDALDEVAQKHSCQDGPGGTRMADGALERDVADRQRHKYGSAGGTDSGSECDHGRGRYRED